MSISRSLKAFLKKRAFEEFLASLNPGEIRQNPKSGDPFSYPGFDGHRIHCSQRNAALGNRKSRKFEKFLKKLDAGGGYAKQLFLLDKE